MQFQINLIYESDYAVEVATYAGNESQHFYPPEEKDGLHLRISPSFGERWIGIFAFGRVIPKSILAIYAMPDPDRFCVVSGGVGYVVSSTNPVV